VFIGLLLLLTRTRVGLIIQAALTHPNMVGALGHNVPLVFMLVFGVGTALAGLAGVIAGRRWSRSRRWRRRSAHPVRGGGGRRAGFAAGRLHRVGADRPDPDLCGGLNDFDHRRASP
jgi:hypothetical protein